MNNRKKMYNKTERYTEAVKSAAKILLSEKRKNNIMKKYLLVLVALVSYNFLDAQQISLNSQYINNDLVQNPAVAGTQKYAPIKLSIRRNWIGVAEAPAVQTISGHMSANNIGLGAIIFNDNFGPEQHIGTQIVASYKNSFTRNFHYSFALAPTLFQYSLDERYFEMERPDDPLITYSIENRLLFDLSAGAYFYGTKRGVDGHKYYFGVTVANMVRSRLKTNQVTVARMVYHYTIMGGFRHDFKGKARDYAIEPSILIKTTGRTMPIPQFDVSMKFHYKIDRSNKFWTMLSLRSFDSFIVGMGLEHKQYIFGCAYDFTFSDLSAITTGSIEMIFGMKIGKGSTSRGRTFY